MCDIIQEGRQTDGQRTTGDMPVQSPNTPMKTNQFILIHELGQLPNHRNSLTDHRRQSRTADTHSETEDEDRIQNDIDCDCHDSSRHGETRMSR